MVQLNLLKDSYDFLSDDMTPARIKVIRKNYGLTQEKFADLLDIKYDTLRSWEGGYRYPASPGVALLKLAEESPQVFKARRKEIINLIRSLYPNQSH